MAASASSPSSATSGPPPPLPHPVHRGTRGAGSVAALRVMGGHGGGASSLMARPDWRAAARAEKASRSCAAPSRDCLSRRHGGGTAWGMAGAASTPAGRRVAKQPMPAPLGWGRAGPESGPFSTALGHFARAADRRSGAHPLPVGGAGQETRRPGPVPVERPSLEGASRGRVAPGPCRISVSRACRGSGGGGSGATEARRRRARAAAMRTCRVLSWAGPARRRHAGAGRRQDSDARLVTATLRAAVCLECPTPPAHAAGAASRGPGTRWISRILLEPRASPRRRGGDAGRRGL